MRKRVQVLAVTTVCILFLTACHGIGTVSESYVNQKDAGQTLELSGKATLKSWVAGAASAREGHYTFWQDQKATAGAYRKVEDTYVLTLSDAKEWKLKIEADSSLRDENGEVWQVQNRVHALRATTELPATGH